LQTKRRLVFTPALLCVLYTSLATYRHVAYGTADRS
jgi:hypothetical protein